MVLARCPILCVVSSSVLSRRVHCPGRCSVPSCAIVSRWVLMLSPPVHRLALCCLCHARSPHMSRPMCCRALGVVPACALSRVVCCSAPCMFVHCGISQPVTCVLFCLDRFPAQGVQPSGCVCGQTRRQDGERNATTHSRERDSHSRALQQHWECCWACLVSHGARDATVGMGNGGSRNEPSFSLPQQQAPVIVITRVSLCGVVPASLRKVGVEWRSARCVGVWRGDAHEAVGLMSMRLLSCLGFVEPLDIPRSCLPTTPRQVHAGGLSAR